MRTDTKAGKREHSIRQHERRAVEVVTGMLDAMSRYPEDFADAKATLDGLRKCVAKLATEPAAEAKGK